MNILTQIIRIIVSVTFIFSGFVKLVDPLGSAYKFGDYFASDVLNIEFLIPYALPFSIVLILIEVMLGVMLLIGCKVKLTVWSLFVLTLIFLFLTWYSAYYDKVSDCGCFGDALKLSPWDTFYKNVILIVLIIFLIFKIYDIHPLLSVSFVERVSFTLLVIFIFISFYVLRHLPIIDFRPYAVGENITKGMLVPEGAQQPVFEDIWIYNVNGKDKTYTTQEKPWNIKDATFVDRKTKTIKVGYEPPIHDFIMERDGEDITGQLLQEEKLLLVVMYDLSKTNRKGLSKLKKISDKALQNGYLVYGFSASSEKDFLKIKNEYNFDFDQLFCDETTLKTIIRANPGIVILDKGTITGKWNWRDFKDIKF